MPKMVSLVLRLLFTLLFSLLPAGNADLAADRAALLRLRSAVNGRTRRWNLSDATPCSWEGVNCDNATNRVTALRLPGDGLSGDIPPNSIGSLTQLRNLSLRHNSLSGLPSDLGSCTELGILILRENQFAGAIPASLFTLNNLVRLDLSGNNFTGEINVGFNNLSNLRTLFLENNQFTGSLPELSTLSRLQNFNVSFNRLNGPIPRRLTEFSSDSFSGNSLCGGPLDSCPGDDVGDNNLSAGAIAGIVIGSIIGLLLILSVIFLLWRRHSIAKISRRVKMSPVPRSPVKPPQFEYRDPNPVIVRETHGSGNGFSGALTEGTVIKNGGNGNDEMVFFGDVGDFSLEELLRASAEVLGKGTCGTTYKAYLEGGGQAIVKRLKYVCVSEREFREKVEGLGVLVHENLIPPRAYYFGKDEKLIVYDCMPMGSLSALLHGNKGAGRPSLSWEFRSRIAFEAARGIDYLHSLGPNITHGNIKSSNILLTDHYGACISEFGITQLLSSSPTLDPIGYRAPEITDSRRISQKADVYSFGVLLLELLTGKDPTNAPGEEGTNLPRWVQSVVEEKWTIDVFDGELLEYENSEEQMVQLLHLAISCTSRHPDRRPSMVEVTRHMNKIYESRQQRQ